MIAKTVGGTMMLSSFCIALFGFAITEHADLAPGICVAIQFVAGLGIWIGAACAETVDE